MMKVFREAVSFFAPISFFLIEIILSHVCINLVDAIGNFAEASLFPGKNSPP